MRARRPLIASLLAPTLRLGPAALCLGPVALCLAPAALCLAPAPLYAESPPSAAASPATPPAPAPSPAAPLGPTVPAEFQRAGQLRAQIEAAPRLPPAVKALVRQEYVTLDAQFHAVWSPVTAAVEHVQQARARDEALVADLHRRVEDHEARAARIEARDRSALEASRAEADRLAADADALRAKVAAETDALAAELQTATAILDRWLAGPLLTGFNRTCAALLDGRLRPRRGATWVQLQQAALAAVPAASAVPAAPAAATPAPAPAASPARSSAASPAPRPRAPTRAR